MAQTGPVSYNMGQ